MKKQQLIGEVNGTQEVEELHGLMHLSATDEELSLLLRN